MRRLRARPRGEEPRDRVALWLVGAATAVGLGLRVFRLDAVPLVYDEMTRAILSSRPLASIPWDLSRTHHFPPLSYVLLHFWGLLGQGDFWLRSLAVLLGTLTIPAFYRLARLWVEPRTASACAWVLALSPYHVQQSQLVREYALFSLMTVLSLWFVARFARSVTWRDGILWAGVTELLVYTHYFGFFVLLVELALLAFHPSMRKQRSLALCISLVLAIALAWLPWLPFFLGRMGVEYESIDVFSLSDVSPHFLLTVANVLAGEYDLGTYQAEFATRPWMRILRPWTGVHWGLFLLGAVLVWRRARWGFSLLSGVLAIPAVLTVLVIHVFRSFMALRYFMAAFLVLALFSGVAVGGLAGGLSDRLGSRWPRLPRKAFFTATVMILALLPVGWNLYRYPTARHFGHHRERLLEALASEIATRASREEPALLAHLASSPRMQTFDYTLVDYYVSLHSEDPPPVYAYSVGGLALSEKGRRVLEPMVDRVPRRFVVDGKVEDSPDGWEVVPLDEWLAGHPRFWMISRGVERLGVYDEVRQAFVEPLTRSHVERLDRKFGKFHLTLFEKE